MKYILFLPAILLFGSCQESPKTNLESLDKKSSREVALKAVEVGDSILHITDQKIWVNGELLVQKIDTIKTAKEVAGWGQQEKASLVKTPIYVTVE